MNWRDVLAAAATVVAALLLFLAVIWFLLPSFQRQEPEVKWRTHYSTVETTVPAKRKPGVTTWIIVCGENTQRVVNNKPTTECKLPDTGGALRRHKAH